MNTPPRFELGFEHASWNWKVTYDTHNSMWVPLINVDDIDLYDRVVKYLRQFKQYSRVLYFPH